MGRGAGAAALPLWTGDEDEAFFFALPVSAGHKP